MTPETKEIIDWIAEGVVESLKFIPDGEVDEAVKYAVEKIANADLNGKPDVVKIIHSAVHSGKLISKLTPNERDDKLFGALDNIVENYQANGEKAIAALLKSIFQKKD